MMERFQRIIYYMSTGLYGLLAVIFLFVFVTSFARNAVHMCACVGLDWRVSGSYVGLLAGLAAYVAFAIFSRVIPKLRHNLNWFMKFTHELTHTLVAVAFFAKIHKFIVMERECSVYYETKIGYVPITLAPYCIPIYTFMLFPFRFAGENRYMIIFDVLIAFSYAFHMHAFIRQTRPSQSDIQGCGLPLSAAFISFVHLCVLSLVLAMPRGGVMNAIGRVFWLYPYEIISDPVGWFYEIIRCF